MDIKNITGIIMLIFIAIVTITSLMILVTTYKQRSEKANFKLPDLYANNKSYRSSHFPKKIPEVSDKEVEELIQKTTPNPFNINIKEIDEELRIPHRRRIYLPNLDKEKEIKQYKYEPIKVKTEFDNLMDEMEDEEALLND